MVKNPYKIYLNDKDTPKGKLIKKLSQKYALTYEDTYYYSRVVDYILDTLMKLGCPITVPDVVEIKIHTNLSDSKQVKENKAYMQRVMSGREQFYYRKQLHKKYLRGKP